MAALPVFPAFKILVGHRMRVGLQWDGLLSVLPEEHNARMARHALSIIAAALLAVASAAAGASEMVCAHPDKPNHSYTVSGDRGVYTWDDHGVERSWELKCNEQRDGSTACHRWEQHGDKGRSVMVFSMLSDGSLIEAGSWAVLDSSMVNVVAGFVCIARGE